MSTLQVNGIPWHHQALDAVKILTHEPYKRRDRVRTVTQIIIHEPVSPFAKRTEATLRRKRYGTHLHVTEVADLWQFGDLRTDVYSHAGSGANGRSIGIEVQNPYVPKKSGGTVPPWVDVISAPWAWAKKGRARKYVVPTLAQLEVCAAIVDALTSCCLDGIEIPRQWPALTSRGMVMGPRAFAWNQPGILSHMVSGVHADGSFPVLYCYLRLCGGLGPKATRQLAMGLATKKIAVIP